jgi:lambda repressor-like predicted transcriptional regulator
MSRQLKLWGKSPLGGVRIVTVSLERREEVKRLILSGLTLREASKRAGVGRGTAQKLRDELKEAGKIPSSEKGLNPDGWPSREKFLAVVATSGMNEYEKCEYCRARGIYAEQLEMWLEACISANGQSVRNTSELQASLKEEALKNKKLERELARKEKALAEAAAILVLRKKADAVWGDEEGA